jgi:hypothetical protein
MSQIAAEMDTYTQLILFITGQGGLTVTDYDVDCDSAGCLSANLAFPGAAWHYLQEVPDNVPQLLLVSPLQYTQPVSVIVGTHSYGEVYFEHEYNPNDKKSIQGYVALIELDESHLDSTGVIVTASSGRGLLLSLMTIECSDLQGHLGDCDPNGDLVVAIDDIIILEKYIFEGGNPPHEPCICDGDPAINIADAASIIADYYRRQDCPNPPQGQSSGHHERGGLPD